MVDPDSEGWKPNRPTNGITPGRRRRRSEVSLTVFAASSADQLWS